MTPDGDEADPNTVSERTTQRAPSDDPETRDRPSGSATMASVTETKPPSTGSSRTTSGGVGERVFRGLTTGSGLVVVAAIALIGLFLVVQAVPSLLANNANFLTSPDFNTSDAGNLRFGIRDLLAVTLLSSLMALAIAMPIGMGIALFLTQYTPARLARPFSYVIGLLAAVPSIVFGLWGILVLAPAIEPIAQFLQTYLGWFFLFAPGNLPVLTGTIFTGGIVLAIMILPIITATTREVFAQTPRFQIEAAQALGATRWEVIRMAVLPYGRSGFIAASMLGLGRALGETIAVLIVIRTATSPSHLSLFDGGATFASKIAAAASEFSQPLPTGAYIAAGLVLFVLTFVVNALARVVAGGKVNG
ncbi:phosphate ABC transporter permease subunit PstC [Actinomycetospora sp. NBRC 106378]|uniref:phosphate ABC transporter permease subunit PstC n=1 Tax=Actinomycetospora sp. NBRC 106378 TaxID=3032208 RepID=UPI0024A00D81|nr:phosphate ABC transporter permease subunit PstC [Actinomycetospora sp. NBRC 106378]GLZ51114.1 phosphate transport system permease protein [Actinomycetospora sp. NBRC 106378]